MGNRHQKAKMADPAKQKAIDGEALMGRVLSPLPLTPPAKDASGKTVERKLSNDSATSSDCATVESDMEQETSIMFEIGRKMIRLYLCENHSCEACLGHFNYIASMNPDYPETVTYKLLQLGFMELAQQILRRFFKEAVKEADGTSSLSVMLTTVVNMTDGSSEACGKVIQLELHIDIIKLLESSHLDPRQTDQGLSSTLCDLADQLMTVLYNVVQVTTEARELYREQGIIEVVQRFRTRTTDSLSCQTIIFLAWVINDEENSILNSSNEVFSFLNKELRSSFKKVTHRSTNGYKAVEILAAINKLAVNDANKARIVKSGVLSSYVKFLEPLMDEKEQLLAAQGLWTLAFKCAKKIKKEKFCIESLELLLKESECDKVRRQVNGALIALGVKQEGSIQAPVLSSQEGLASEAEEKRKRIFISYQHSSKETVVNIRDRLRVHGYTVWMDAEDICGSIAEDITNGIDTSSIVLVCLSQKYYESPYCKKEVIYSDVNQKEIIPLTMEPKYKPHGWLSFRMTDKLRIDFSQPHLFDASLRILLQRLQKSFDEVDSERRNNQPEVATSSSHVPIVHTDVNSSGATWEPEVVRNKTCPVSHSDVNSSGATWEPEVVRNKTCPVSHSDVNSSGATCEPDVARKETCPVSHSDVNSSGASCEPEVVLKKACPVSYSASTTAGVFSWTKADVREWLERNNFQHLTKWFDDYNGPLLLEFQRVLEKSPESVAPSFIAAHSVKDFLQLIMALRTLP